ncbi:sigma-54 interaction domain-containing protein [Pelosinus fermentans]|uniref:PAS modulated sigma54 specific transcriptional regulator, Fis family n=1 Tax=Pelosinus fermentans JBW45 TaxID=1192197 RepID=I9NY21_9FIRM|nr:sigma-54-dependent Fis family transcriptional regulator [Pelosinus fermentans]AJQ27009.1 PAS modulated sigma54 specific transcriptional regulator, Fis family [Pelosinus fermentans JBW45]
MTKSKELVMDQEHQLREQLAIAEQKLLLYETILNSLDVGIQVIDKQETTIVYNSMMAKLEGEDVNNVLGKKLLNTMPYLQAEDSTLITALKLGRPLNDRRQTYITAQNKRVITVNSTTPIYFNNKLVGALEIAKDITFIQMLAEKIIDLQQNLSAQKNALNVAQPFRTRYTFSDIIGNSDTLKTVKVQANRVARSSSNILLYGETGTGKELFAQSIHNASLRKQGPFVAINCAALPEHLLEGLLFGTAKGGFTGALDRPGFFEQAQGGTLLLDEINSMNINLQAKLLRVLQEYSIRRVGATNEIAINVRVISAINVNPFDAIAQKQLREDLYYRLGTVTLHIPPLREHKEDIPIYIDHFIEKYNQSLELDIKKVSATVLDAFYQHSWPGNIRELQHAIEGAMNLVSTEQELQMHHLPALFLSNLLTVSKSLHAANINCTEPTKLIEHRETIEKELICAAFNKSNGNITWAAKSLGLTRQLLQYKLKKYNLK